LAGPRPWDVFFVLDNETEEEFTSITILNAQKGVTASAGTPAVVNFSYGSQGSPLVSGYVRDVHSEAPILGAEVLITNGDNHLAAFAETDENGYWFVRHLPEGNYTATAGHATYTGSPTTPITASNGNPYLATLLELTAPAGPGSISGRITELDTPGPLYNARVTLRGISGQYWHFFTEADGLYSFTGLPPGCYGLQVFPPTTTDYQISEMDYINLAEGEDLVNFDVEVEPGAYTISGRVYSGGSGLQYVNVHYDSEEFRRIDQHTQTDENGDYTLTNLPSGKGEISIRADLTNLAFTGQEINLTGSIIGLDFNLAPESSVTGRVVDENNDGIANTEVRFDTNFGEQEAFTNSDGYFTIGNLPAGLGEFEVEPEIGSGFCIPADRVFFLGEGTRSEIGTTKLEPCALVQGTVIAPDPDEICDLEVWAPGSDFEADPDVEGGSYQMRLPQGTHLIYLDSEDDGPYNLAAYPVEVTVNATDIGSGTPVEVPDDLNIISVFNSNYGTISGNVNKLSGADPTGEMLIGVLPAGSLDDATPEKFDRAELIQIMWLTSFGPYSLFPIPPVPPGEYDVFCALETESPEGLESISILGWHKKLTVGAGQTVVNIDFDYAHSGSDYFDGYITSKFGNPVMGALVLVKDGGGDLIGFTETDQNGYYRIYNIPAGDYTMEASHPDLGDASSPINIPANTTVDLALVYNATSKVPGLDLVYNGSGVQARTYDSVAPSTALSHWVKVVDYDGVADGGSSHTVTVTYPNGMSQHLWFVEKRDPNSAIYELWDSDIPQPIDTGTYSGDYVYRVMDPNGDWSEATDELFIDLVDVADETTFAPGFGTPHSITALFDDVGVNGSLYDDFESGFDGGKWIYQPSEVTYVGGEAQFEKTWFPESQMVYMGLQNPGSIDEHSAVVRVPSIVGNSKYLMARVVGRYCVDSSGEVDARVSIRGDEAFYNVYTDYWDGDHRILAPLAPLTSMGPVTQGNRYRLTLSWDDTTGTLTFSVVGLDDSVNYSTPYTVPGPISPTSNPMRGIGVTGWVSVDTTTPTFNWAEVPGSTQYRIRIYGMNDNQIYEGYSTSPPYILPPGVVKPNGIYQYRIYAFKDHQWFEWDNVSHSDRGRARFIVDSSEAQDPYIDFYGHGAYTWNEPPPFEPYTHFYARIHDAQGVPENIESVTVTVPGGGTVNLYYDEYVSSTSGKYRGTYFGDLPAAPATYTFNVVDKNGNPAVERSDTITPAPIGFIDEGSLTPEQNYLANGTGLTISWNEVTGAAFYQIQFYDKDFNYLFNVKVADNEEIDTNEYTLPPGLLKENSLYRYRIYTYREFIEDLIDNGSTTPPQGVWNANTFFTTATASPSHPTISLGDFGVAVWQAPHPKTGNPYNELTLAAMVSDPDGVPESIKRVEVKFPNGSIHELKYSDSPDWGHNYILIINYADASSIEDASNSSGVYEFKVVDFNDNEDTIQDTLPEINTAFEGSANWWVTDVTPVDGTVVATTTPAITWSAVPGAAYYKVRIMSAWDHPTVHWSPELTGTQYMVPASANLADGDTHSYRVYAYQEAIDNQIDFYSSYASWHAKNNHFTIDLAQTDIDGDGIPDSSDNCPNDSNADQADANNDGVGDVCDTVSDTDGDGLTDAEEVNNRGTDPDNPDSDGDWVNDGDEVNNGTSPTNPGEFTPPGTGAIRGTVKDSGGTPITSNNIRVQLFTGDPCGGNQQVDDIVTSDGTYIFVGLDHIQDYWVRADNMWQSNYVNEWYASSASSIECNGAQSVDVPENDLAEGIDFQLDMGVEISGTVYQNDGSTQIVDTHIQVVAFRAADPCQGHLWSTGTQTNLTDGSFALKGVPQGTVYLSTSNMNQSNYVNEWWRNIAVGSTTDCSLAELLSVPAGGVTGLSFQLDLGGSVSGYVTDTSDNPIPNLWVHVNDSLCGSGQWFGGDDTDEFGYYKIWGIPESTDVYVQACADCRNMNWVDEWWDGDINSGSIDCNGAAPISISPDTDSGGISFKLEAGGSISGHIEDNAGDPIINLHIWAQDYDTGQHMGGVNTNDLGNYTIGGLPSGNYRVQTCASCSGLAYADEFFDNVYSHNNASPVSVTAPDETSGINFTLEAGNTISGTISGLDQDQHVNIYAKNDNGTFSDGSDDFGFGTGIHGGGSGSDEYTLYVAPDLLYTVEFNPDDGLFTHYKEGLPYGIWDWADATRLDLTDNVAGIDITVQADTDQDSMPDDWETEYLGGMSRDGNGDLDGDGLNDRDEFRYGTLPNNPDTDGDKISDWYEIDRGTDPNQASDAPPIPITGSIINIHQSDGTFETSIAVDIDYGFVGTLPDDIDTVTITGPELTLSKDDLEFSPEWNEWAIIIPGSPQLGTYTFTVTSGSATGTAFDTQTVIRDIPIADHTKFFPIDGATITSSTPTFSWPAVDYSGATMYYRLKIRDLSDVRAYASGRVAGMLSHSVPLSTKHTNGRP